MKMTNAIKKMEKIGPVTRNEYGYAILVHKGQELSVSPNGRLDNPDVTVATVRLRRLNDHDDSMSDYCAGMFYPTVTAAIKSMCR